MPLLPGAAPSPAYGDRSGFLPDHDWSKDSPRSHCPADVGHTVSVPRWPGHGPTWHHCVGDRTLDRRAHYSENVVVMGLTHDSTQAGANRGDLTCETNLAHSRPVAT